MSFNVGGILVRVKDGVTQDSIAQEIKNYWLAKGAHEDPRDPLEIDSLSLEDNEDHEGRLGYAISPPAKQGLFFGKRWIAIAESERYNIDWGLAEQLAKVLGTEVCWYTMYGASDAGEVRMLNSTLKPPTIDEDDEDAYSKVEQFVSKFPLAFLYFDKLVEEVPDARRDFKVLGFRDVNYDDYRTGPGDSESDEELESAAGD